MSEPKLQFEGCDVCGTLLHERSKDPEMPFLCVKCAENWRDSYKAIFGEKEYKKRFRVGRRPPPEPPSSS